MQAELIAQKEARAKAEGKTETVEQALAGERARADPLGAKLEHAENRARTAEEAAEQLRRADEARRGGAPQERLAGVAEPGMNVPSRVGPVEFGRLAGWVTVRCRSWRPWSVRRVGNGIQVPGNGWSHPAGSARCSVPCRLRPIRCSGRPGWIWTKAPDQHRSSSVSGLPAGHGGSGCPALFARGIDGQAKGRRVEIMLIGDGSESQVYIIPGFWPTFSHNGTRRTK